ncbi:MAG: hypothetical protein QOJ37_492 [Pseudonocardiales bacterium]|nr:hypothetical protein [Pseudonocardiales bacterium]
MRGSKVAARITRAGLPALAVAALAFVALPAAAEAHTPPKPAATQAASPSTPAPHLPISVNLGGLLNINVDLPLTLPGLLGVNGSTPPPSSGTNPPVPPPTVSPPPTRSTQPTRSTTSSHPARPTGPSTRTDVITAPARPANSAGVAPPVTIKTSPPRQSSTTTPNTRKSVPPSTLVARAIQPGSPELILIALTCICAVGVAAVVVLGGRRGRRAA